MSDKLTYEELEQRVRELERFESDWNQIEESLRERVKELNCLQALSKLIEKEDNLERLFQNGVEVLPKSWLHPEIAGARIIYEDRQYQTENFRETDWRQSSDIKVLGKPEGIVEVCYLEERPIKDEGPFLQEERDLLNLIAERLGSVIERKQTEEFLRLSESRLFAALNTAPFPVAIVDLDDDKIIQWSQSAVILFGHTAPTASEWYQIAYPDPVYRMDVIKRWKASLKKAHDTNRTVNAGEYTVTCKDGSEKICELYASFISGYLIVTYNDFTERKKALDSLENERNFLSTVLDHIEEAIIICNTEGQLIRFNEFARRLHGIPEKPIKPDEWSQHYDLYRVDGKTSLPVHEIPLVKALRGEKVVGDEIMIAPKNSKPRYMLCNGQALYDYRGKKIGAVMAMHDLTEQKRIEDALRDSEQMYRTTFDAIPDSITVTRQKDGRYKYVNDGFFNITGYSPAEVIGKTPYEINLYVNDSDRERMVQTLRDNGELLNFEIPFRRKDGTVWDSFFSARPIVMNGENCLIALTKDVTELKRAEDEKQRLETQLRQAQKMESIGRLAGGVAHDFNNMLGVILGHTELGLLEIDKNKDLYTNLKEIQKAATRSADITKQLLAYARKQTISPRQLDLNDTVKNMLNMLRRLIGEDIELVWKPTTHIWPVKMDPTQIDQILANLCVNARDAIDGVGRLTIETDRQTFDKEYCKEHQGFVPGDFVRLVVSDNGCGMDKKTLDNLFEPFYTTKDVGKGTGLGLATVYGIVQQNNGFINVYSEPDQGSTFKIYLPRFIADEKIAKDVPQKKSAARGTETILLVEDEPSILTMTRMMLERKGYTVLSTPIPAEAIEMAKTHTEKVHLLMTDVVMPKMNGKDLAVKLKAFYPDIRVLFMSGYTSDVIARQGILEDGVSFIQKPFSVEDLARKLREVLDTAPEKNQN